MIHLDTEIWPVLPRVHQSVKWQSLTENNVSLCLSDKALFPPFNRFEVTRSISDTFYCSSGDKVVLNCSHLAPLVRILNQLIEVDSEDVG